MSERLRKLRNLRDASGASLVECKDALESVGWDFKQAVEVVPLRRFDGDPGRTCSSTCDVHGDDFDAQVPIDWDRAGRKILKRRHEPEPAQWHVDQLRALACRHASLELYALYRQTGDEAALCRANVLRRATISFGMPFPERTPALKATMPRDAESPAAPAHLVIHWSASEVSEDEAAQYVAQYTGRLRDRWGGAHVRHVAEVLKGNRGAVLSAHPLGYDRAHAVYREGRDVGLRLVRLEGGAVGVMGAEEAPDPHNHWSSWILTGQQAPQPRALGNGPDHERWRTGRSVGRTVYIHTGDDPTGDLVGLMDTPELADRVVGAVSAVSTLRAFCADALSHGFAIAPWQVLRILDGATDVAGWGRSTEANDQKE